MAKPVKASLFELHTLDEPNVPADNLPTTTRQWNKALERTHSHKITLHEQFALALLTDFQTHGVQAIRDMRENNPGSYIKIIRDFLPKEIAIDVTHTDASAESINASRLSFLRELLTGANADRRVVVAPGNGGEHLPPTDARESKNGPVLSADEYLEQKGLLAPVDT